MDWFVKHGKRALRITGASVIIIVGLVLMIPGVPGPGFIVIFAGLSILAIDFLWARRLKHKLEGHAKTLANKLRGKSAK